jgi:hypothetical protein
MFVHVILVHAVEMATVKIAHMAVMANRGVPAFRAMPMSVVGMVCEPAVFRAGQALSA